MKLAWTVKCKYTKNYNTLVFIQKSIEYPSSRSRDADGNMRLNLESDEEDPGRATDEEEEEEEEDGQYVGTSLFGNWNKC